jgi:ABC-type enterobactin transport system permease subunit
MLDIATLVIVGLGLASVPFAFLEYVVSRAKREAARKIEHR